MSLRKLHFASLKLNSNAIKYWHSFQLLT